MNSNEQIEFNETATFFPTFGGLNVFKRNLNIVFLQGRNEITIPIVMANALVLAIDHAKGVNDES